MIHAEYIGTQDDGEGRSFPLFNLYDSDEAHPLHKSTVGVATLIQLKIGTILYPNSEKAA